MNNVLGHDDIPAHKGFAVEFKAAGALPTISTVKPTLLEAIQHRVAGIRELKAWGIEAGTRYKIRNLETGKYCNQREWY